MDQAPVALNLESRSPQRILILRLGAMGDVIHALPAVTLLRQLLPHAEIGWVIEERWHELLSSLEPEAIRSAAASDAGFDLRPEQPLVNRIHLVNTRAWRSRLLLTKTWIELRDTLRSLQRTRYEVSIDLQGAWKSAFWGAACSVPLRIGFLSPREPGADLLYNRPVRMSSSKPAASSRRLHIIEQNAELAMALFRRQPGETVETPVLPQASLPLDAAQEEWARKELRQSRLTEGEFAIINPGAGWEAKCWPADRYGEVARGLSRMGIRCLVNRGPGEEVAANDVVAASGGSAVVRQYSIGQLIAITRRARLFVGGDTGPMHLAAALRIPVVGIFGPTNPSRNGPYGTAAEVLRNPESVTNHSRRARSDGTMLSITTEAVLAAAQALLERTSQPGTPKPGVAGTPQEAQRG